MEAEAKAGVAETPVEFTMRRDREIAAWLDRKAALDSVKPQELEARNTVAATLFPEPKKGTNRYHLNGGYAIKLVYGTTYTLGDKDKMIGEGEEARKVTINEQVYEMLRKLYEQLIKDGLTEGDANEFCKSLVKWKPELNELFYITISPELKTIVNEILTTKPATPQLTFEVPKK